MPMKKVLSMKNKVLIVHQISEDIHILEDFLLEVMGNDGEIFFAEEGDQGLEILMKEKPSLVFLQDDIYDSEKWQGAHIVVLRSKKEPEDENLNVLYKPFKKHQVFEKCHSVLDLFSKTTSVPPM